jgi:hypothetical protein
MPPCESTLGYIDLVPSDSDEEYSSQSPPRGVVGCIIDLVGSDSEGGAHSRGGGGHGDGGGGLGGA